MVSLDFHCPIDDDLTFIADNMRPDDIEEVLAAGSESPFEALVSSVEHSSACVVASYQGTPLVIYGFKKGSVLGDKGLIWMLGATQSLDYPREFMVYTRRVLEEMLLECSYLYNYVYSNNKTSIKWLKALGFTIEEAKPYGINKELFHKFYMEKLNV